MEVEGRGEEMQLVDFEDLPRVSSIFQRSVACKGRWSGIDRERDEISESSTEDDLLLPFFPQTGKTERTWYPSFMIGVIHE